MVKYWPHLERARSWVLEDWSPEFEFSKKKRGGASGVKHSLNSRLYPEKK